MDNKFYVSCLAYHKMKCQQRIEKKNNKIGNTAQEETEKNLQHLQFRIMFNTVCCCCCCWPSISYHFACSLALSLSLSPYLSPVHDSHINCDSRSFLFLFQFLSLFLSHSDSRTHTVLYWVAKHFKSALI